MTLGSIDDARHALLGLSDCLDAGTNRTAYLINGVIYKVMFHPDYPDNRFEYQNYMQWSRLSLDPIARLPYTFLWEVDGVDVIAMEYVSGEPIDNNETEYVESLFPFSSDIWWANVLVNEDGYWLIDMGC